MKIQGDPVLAEIFRGMKPEPSRIIRTDFFATAFNRERLGDGAVYKRIVDLSCGHKAISKNQNTMTCPRCVQLLKHGMDYEAWLRGVSDNWPYDGLHWREDPCRRLNEHTDLAGNFIDDPEAKGDQS